MPMTAPRSAGHGDGAAPPAAAGPAVSDVVVPGLLDGLGNVWRLVAKQLCIRTVARLARAPREAPNCAAADPAPLPATRAGPDRRPSMSRNGARVAVVLKGYPRLSETFIAQEIAGARGAAASRSKSGRCAGRPTRHAIPSTIAIARAGRLSAGVSARTIRAACSRAWRQARRLPGYARRAGKFLRRPAARPHAPTGSAAAARRWCWRPSCRPRSSGSTPISCTRRPR